MIKRLLLSFAFALAFLLACMSIFAVFANAPYPNATPHWLALTLYLSFSWPLQIVSAAFPGAVCILFEECDSPVLSELLTIATSPLAYTGLFYSILSYRSRKRARVPPA